MNRLSRVAAVTVGLLAMGCSSSGGSDVASEDQDTTSVVAETATSTTAAPLSEDEYLVQGNAICEDMQTLIDEIEAEFGPGGPETLEDFAVALEATAAVVDDTLAALRGLPSPEGDEETLDAMHDGVEEFTSLTLELAAAAEAGDSAEMDVLGAQLDELTARVNQKYADYGLTVCAE